MDKETYRIAVASSDGIVVNSHFGRAGTFYIYKVEQQSIQFVEIRKVQPVCDGGNHEDGKLIETIEKLSDCKYLLVSRIGNAAATIAKSHGIDAYEIPDEITKAIEQLIKYIAIEKLFE